MASHQQSTVVLEAIRRQQVDPDDHDLSLIAQSLSRTPEERLNALEEYLEFVHLARPGGPLVE
jgi:hypothetical protein